MTDREIIDLVAEKTTEAYLRGIMDGVKIADMYRKAITTPIDLTPYPPQEPLTLPQEPLTVSVYAAPANLRWNTTVTKMEVDDG